MKERPILFSAPMVRALLNGTKTQTRRTLKRQPPANAVTVGTYHHPDPRPHFYALTPSPDKTSALKNEISEWEPIPCPYGQPGDRLWVRETCRAHELTDDEARNDTHKVMETMDLEVPVFGLDGVIYAADGAFRKIENSMEAAEKWGDLYNYGGKKGATVPPIHMPRWASRITLEVTAVRVERLQDISEADAQAEGVHELPLQAAEPGCWWTADVDAGAALHGRTPDGAFRLLWESINGSLSWHANPWVWVVEFKRI